MYAARLKPQASWIRVVLWTQCWLRCRLRWLRSDPAAGPFQRNSSAVARIPGGSSPDWWNSLAPWWTWRAASSPSLRRWHRPIGPVLSIWSTTWRCGSTTSASCRSSSPAWDFPHSVAVRPACSPRCGECWPSSVRSPERTVATGWERSHRSSTGPAWPWLPETPGGCSVRWARSW